MAVCGVCMRMLVKLSKKMHTNLCMFGLNFLHKFDERATNNTTAEHGPLL